jgi:hypothetical protein
MAQAYTAALSWRVAEAAPSDSACACGPAGVGGAGVVDVPVRADRAGRPLLLPEPGSELAQEITRQAMVTVTVACPAPFTGLALRGFIQPGGAPDQRDELAHRVTLLSARFTGARGLAVPIAQYLAAAPDPLWRQAPAVLDHLEHGHMAELVACIRAHGMPQTQWVFPHGLDRFGLRLVALTVDGAASIRLSFPDGPVASFQDIPDSVRTVLACRCPASRLRLDDA